MSDWDHKGVRSDDADRRRREAEWRDRDFRAQEFRDRRPVEGRTFGPPGQRRDEHRPDYNPEIGPYAPGGGAAQGYGEGGDSAYGQMARGGSDTRGGGFGGANVGGWGQSGLTSQWGGGGYGPLNTGSEYGQDGGRFGPQGYNEGDFGTQRHDQHAASYHSWRDAQLANHDRDYGHWRNEQARRYDADYDSWRNERHSAFSKEFEGWRTGRGGQAATPAPNVNEAHGANPTLSKIADGHEGHTPRPDHDKHDKDKGPDRT